MTQEYIIKKKYCRKDLSGILALSIILTLGLLLLVYMKGPDSIRIGIPVFLFFLLIQIIPFLLLHDGYYDANRSDSLLCDYENKILTYCHGNEPPITLKAIDISRVKYYLSYAANNKNPGRFLWDRYSYCDIEIPNDKSLFITSLLVPDINFFLSNMNIDPKIIEKKPGFYSSITKSSSDW